VVLSHTFDIFAFRRNKWLAFGSSGAQNYEAIAPAIDDSDSDGNLLQDLQEGQSLR